MNTNIYTRIAHFSPIGFYLFQGISWFLNEILAQETSTSSTVCQCTNFACLKANAWKSFSQHILFTWSIQTSSEYHRTGKNEQSTQLLVDIHVVVKQFRPPQKICQKMHQGICSTFWHSLKSVHSGLHHMEIRRLLTLSAYSRIHYIQIFVWVYSGGLSYKMCANYYMHGNHIKIWTLPVVKDF